MAGVTFYDDDSDVDKRLKTAMLRIYNSKLQQRQERKDFVIERGFVGDKRLKEYRNNKEFRQKFDIIRPFIRMHPKDGMWELIDCLFEQVTLARKVRQFQEYRRAGLTRRKQIQSYVAAKKRRAAPAVGERRPGSVSSARGRVTPTTWRKGSIGGVAGALSPPPPADGLLDLEGAAALSLAEVELTTAHAILPSQVSTRTPCYNGVPAHSSLLHVCMRSVDIFYIVQLR